MRWLIPEDAPAKPMVSSGPACVVEVDGDQQYWSDVPAGTIYSNMKPTSNSF